MQHFQGGLTLEITGVLPIGLYPVRRAVMQYPLDGRPNYRPEVGKLPLRPRWTEGRFLSGFVPETEDLTPNRLLTCLQVNTCDELQNLLQHVDPASSAVL